MVNDENLIKAINRARSKERPPNPKDLNFELAENGILPALNVRDIEIGKGDNKRWHLVCFTDEQASLLGTRQRLYMDGTFKIVKKPFVQLYNIHSFIRIGNQKKWHPFCTCWFRGEAGKNNFKFILEVVLNNKHEVTQFVVDFEKAVWLALKDVYGDSVKVFGCGFHWTQCIFRRLKKLGLTTAYRSKTETLVRSICW